MQNERLTVRHVDDVIVVEVLDKLIDRLDTQAVDEISHALLAVAPKGAQTNLLVDFSRVGFMGSSLLGTLIRLRIRTMENGGALKLCALNAAIAEMFSIVRLDHILDIYDDQQTALDSFRESESETNA